MVLHLLSLGRGTAQDGPAAVPDVKTVFCHGAVHEEILLFCPDGHVGPLDSPVAEELEETHGAGFHGIHRFEERGFEVQGGAVIGDEHRGDAEGSAFLAHHDEGRARRVPGAVAPGLESGPDAARGKGGSVGLALDEFFSLEGLDGHPAFILGHEGHVLFGGHFRPGVEPVGPVGGPLREGPFLHGRRHHVRHGRVELLSSFDGGHERLENMLGKSLLHCPPVENVHSENFPCLVEFHFGSTPSGCSRKIKTMPLYSTDSGH